ncbi:MAG: hydrogenase maturation protease [Thermoanaerobaculia bacterium]
MRRTAVFGIGNVLIGDDAAGPTIIHHLTTLWEFPDDVVVEDLGTPSLDLAGRLRGLHAVIFVDAVSVKAEPGTIHTFDRDQILKHPPGLRISPHDPSLKETLLTSEFAGDGPQDIVLVGIVPKTTQGLGLSPEVAAAVPRAIDEVIAELNRRGFRPRRNATTEVPMPWWEKA